MSYNYNEERLNNLLKTELGRLLHTSTITKLKETFRWSYYFAKDPNPFISFIGKNNLIGSFSSLKEVQLMLKLYNEYGLDPLIYGLKLSQNLQCSEPYPTISYVAEYKKEHGRNPTYKELKAIAIENGIETKNLFNTFRYYDLNIRNIDKTAIEYLKSYFSHEITPVLLHGNPFKNKKFKSWVEKMKDTEQLINLEKNIQYIIRLFDIILDRKNNENWSYNDYAIFRECLLKNREDIMHLMQPLPDLYLMVDADPLLRHQIEIIRDLFFDKEYQTLKTYRYVFNKDSFMHYKSFFLEEALAKDYDNTPVVHDECDLFI